MYTCFLFRSDPDLPGPDLPETPIYREGQLPPIKEIYVISPRYTGHPDLPGKTLSPEHPGKSGSDCIAIVILFNFRKRSFPVKHNRFKDQHWPDQLLASLKLGARELWSEHWPDS
eukprot:sb/3476699/